MDEYQDTNRPQYELMRMLAGAEHNVCAVGDEDQSIYSWRGADIRNILEFEQDFPEARIIRLEQNYRSTQNILQAASAVVANNLKRKGKNLWTERRAARRSATTKRPTARTKRCSPPTTSPSICARRRPRRASLRARPCCTAPTRSRGCLKKRMRRYQMKYHVVGGFSFYERAEIKDMISYLKVIHNPGRFDCPAAGDQSRRRAASARPRWRRWSASRWRRASSLWSAIGEAVRGSNCCRRVRWRR